MERGFISKVLLSIILLTFPLLRGYSDSCEIRMKDKARFKICIIA